MPNLILVGFPSSDAGGLLRRMRTILSEFDLDDFVVTVLNQHRHLSSVFRDLPDHVGAVELKLTENDPPDFPSYHSSSPYIIVRDTDDGRMLRIAHLLNERLNVDVEAELIDAFFPKRK
jgi:hypothetical protein